MKKIHESMWEGCGKGFTLIELLIVIAVLGVLAAIAVPTYLGQRHKALVSEATQNMQLLRLFEEEYRAENGRYWPNPDNTSWYGFGLENQVKSFKPGPRTSLKFEYGITTIPAATGVTDGSKFFIYATGKAGTAVEGIQLKLNEKNELTKK